MHGFYQKDFEKLQNLPILYSAFYSAVENNSKLFIRTFCTEGNYHQIFILNNTFTIENTSSIKHLT